MTKQLVRNTSLAEQLFDILREDLQTGDYVPGQKLMSEAKIAEKYEVSRITVRAAIARLSALGYVETRNGEGIFVKELDKDNLLKTVSSLVLEPQMLDDVNAFRKLLDLECVNLTIRNASDEDLKSLSHACDAFTECLDKVIVLDEDTKKEIIDLDYMFHLKICELSGNLLYPLVYKTVQEALKQHICTNLVSRWYFNRLDRKNMEAIERFRMGHVNLLKAIMDRDQARAKRIALAHIDYDVMNLPGIKN